MSTVLLASVNAQEKRVTTLLRYIKNIVVKDEILFEKVETFESRQAANILINYFYEEFYREEFSYAENIERFKTSPMYEDYQEQNEYIAYLENLLSLYEIDITFIEIRLADPFTIFYYDKKNTPLAVHTSFARELVQEYEYQKINFLPTMYKEEELFISMFRFSLMISTVLRVIKEDSDKRIDLDTNDIQLLDNFILSYGFVLNGLLKDSIKAKFALSLHKLFRTKGSFTNIKEINQLFNYSELIVYNLYLFFDEELWITNGSPADKTGYFFFLAVNEMEGETVAEVYDHENIFNERKRLFQKIIENDNTWLATENDLYDEGIKFIKSKYFFVEDKRTVELMTDGMSLLSNIARRLESTGRSDQFRFSFEPLANTDLFTMLKYYIFTANRLIHNNPIPPNQIFDITTKTSDTDRNLVFTGFDNTDNFYSFVDGITDKDDLISKFEEKIQEITELRSRRKDYRVNLNNLACPVDKINCISFELQLDNVFNFQAIRDETIPAKIRSNYENADSMNSELLNGFGIVHLDNKGAFYETINFFKTFFSKMLFKDKSYDFDEFMFPTFDCDNTTRSGDLSKDDIDYDCGAIFYEVYDPEKPDQLANADYHYHTNENNFEIFYVPGCGEPTALTFDNGKWTSGIHFELESGQGCVLFTQDEQNAGREFEDTGRVPLLNMTYDCNLIAGYIGVGIISDLNTTDRSGNKIQPEPFVEDENDKDVTGYNIKYDTNRLGFVNAPILDDREEGEPCMPYRLTLAESVYFYEIEPFATAQDHLYLDCEFVKENALGELKTNKSGLTKLNEINGLGVAAYSTTLELETTFQKVLTDYTSEYIYPEDLNQNIAILGREVLIIKHVAI